MEFDQDGKRIRGSLTYRLPVDDDHVVTDLESRHPGISDSHLGIALDTIPADKHEEFHKILSLIEADQDRC